MTEQFSHSPRRRRAILAGALSLLLAVAGLGSLTAVATAKPSAVTSKNAATVPAGVSAQGIGVQAIPGNWTLAFDWYCDGSYSTTPIVFNANGTWSDGSGYSGPWVSVAGMLTFTFNNSETTYSGVVASRSVTGIQTTFTGLSGCFYMLQGGALSAAGSDDDRRDSAGRS
ncbi:hypothetical protein AB0H63_17385 [Micromonospora echinospora]|uniref:hypothetical protein n=1 Tax=Micromonospora echinospora TaxID=1877 RepID=UPI0033D751B7